MTAHTDRSWPQYLDALHASMQALSVRDLEGRELGPEGFSALAELTCRVRQAKGFCYLAGNGASASMASHFSADLAKNAGLRTMVFTDPALLTALGNDMSYPDVFSEPVGWYMAEQDMLVLISSSGNSPNVVAAASAARRQGGAVVTLSAMGPDNALRSLGDLNFYVPAATYGLAETAHAAILHHWTDSMVRHP
ncbi:SIS domain-containing protein [Humidesulfovibrio sp.]|uniref:SIS domain-containing protein n=1 Tax=Humidesulfovibrio sp. TaxID=2910988 RepID=UPI00280BCA13|nr:SIS domain-containing protein [Humidesulfovibrio sp.]